MTLHDLPFEMSMLVQEMMKRGVSCRQIPKTIIIEALYGQKKHLLSQYTLPIVPQGYCKLIDNKINFKTILGHKKIPYLLKNHTFDPSQLSSALAFVNQTIGFPVVCKPIQGMGMHLVFAGIHNEEDFVHIWKKHYSSLSSNIILVEQYLPNSSDYRFICFRDHEPAVLCRHDPYIIGNEHHSIKQIVRQENKIRANKDTLSALVIEDEEADRALKDQYLTPDSVVSNGQVVKLRYGADINKGGEYEVINHSHVHPHYWQLVHKVWDIFPKMPYFSLDILSSDITLPTAVNRTAINESHVGASVYPFFNPNKGERVNLYAHFVDLLFPESAYKH